jgi:hypothetical protein
MGHHILKGRHDVVARLEARVAALERALKVTGASITLTMGDSELRVSKTGVSIRSDEVTVRAERDIAIKTSGDLVMKGSRILQN